MIAWSWLFAAILTTGVADLQYSADGKLLVVTDGGGWVWLYDAADPQKPPRKVGTESNGIGCLALSSDRMQMTIGDPTGHIELFDFAKKIAVAHWRTCD